METLLMWYLILCTLCCIFAHRLRDETMADKLMYITNDDTQNYLFNRLQLAATPLEVSRGTLGGESRI